MEATRTPTKERRLAALRGALREGSWRGAARMVASMHPAEVANLIESLPPAQREVERASLRRVYGQGFVVNLLNPTLVILGAMLAKLYPAVEVPVRDALRRAVLRAPGEQVRLAVPELGADADQPVVAGQQGARPLEDLVAFDDRGGRDDRPEHGLGRQPRHDQRRARKLSGV